MKNQPELFSGRELKANGIRRVLVNNIDWQDLVQPIIRSLSASQQAFTAEDVRKACMASGVPHPLHPNAWGAAMNKASQAGIIRHIGYRKNNLASAHARVVGVWTSAARGT